MTETSFTGSTFPAVDDLGRAAKLRLASDGERRVAARACGR